MAYGNRENHVVVQDLKANKQLYVHKAAAFADQRLARIAFNWAESEVYFLSDLGTAYRFPIAGGRGTSVRISQSDDLVQGYAKFKVSEDGEYISCLQSGKSLLAIPLPMPTALRGFGEEKTFIDFSPPELRTWQGQVLNHGIVASDRFERNGFLIQEIKPYASDEFSNQRNLGIAPARTSGFVFSVDRAERFAWKIGAGPDGTPGVDIYDLTYFTNPISLSLPHTDADLGFLNDLSWASAESKRFVLYSKKDKSVQVFRLSSLDATPAWKFQKELRNCLMREDYSQIDKLMAPLLRSPLSISGGTGLPATLEVVMNFRDCQQYFESESDFYLRIKTWQRACPDSELARLVVAYSAICRGFAARGSGTADKVTEAGWRDLKKYGKEADEVLAPLFKLARPPAEAYLFQLRVALMLGWDIDKQLDLMAQLIDLDANYYPFHQQAMLNLLPRWSGQVGDCETYASHLAKKLGAVQGEAMYGRLAVELMKYHLRAEFVESTKFDLKRAFNGLLKWSKNSPNDLDAPIYAIFFYYNCELPENLLTEENKAEFLECKKRFEKLINTFAWNTSVDMSHPQMRNFFSKAGKFLKN